MSRRRPRLGECRTMDDFVRGGFARAVTPNTEAGYRAYGAGRVFAAAPVLELVASLAAGGTGPGINDPLTTTWTGTADGLDGTLTDFAGTPWTGSGTAADPYRLTFATAAPADYLTLPALAFTAEFGIEAWISPTGASSYHPILGCWDGSYVGSPDTNPGYLVYLSTGTLRIEMCDGALHYKDSGQSGLGISDLRGAGLAHVALVWDGSYIRGYVAGVETGNVAWGYGSGTPTASSLVGKFWGGSFAGDLAVLRAYDGLVTPAMVAQNSAVGPAPLPASSLVFTDIVTVDSTGVTAAGTNVAYARNSSGTYFGPVVVAASAYSAGEQTALAATWADIPALFRLVKPGDYLIPLGTDSRAFLRL